MRRGGGRLGNRKGGKGKRAALLGVTLGPESLEAGGDANDLRWGRFRWMALKANSSACNKFFQGMR